MRDFQDFNLFSAFYPDDSNISSAMQMASELGLGLEPLAGLQALGLSNAFATQTSHPVTPTGPDSSAETLGGKNCMQNYQDLNNSNSQIKTDPRIGLEPLAGLQALGLSTPFASQASQPGTPTVCGSDTESLADGRTSRSCSATTTSETHRKARLYCQTFHPAPVLTMTEQTKRRLQNRQAQRRFRERKDEYLQALEKKTTCLEKRNQELLEECNRKTEEACQARKEMETLSRENEDLRKRWRLIVLLLSLPNNRAQCPTTTLLGNEASQLLASTPITDSAPVSKDAIEP